MHGDIEVYEEICELNIQNRKKNLFENLAFINQFELFHNRFPQDESRGNRDTIDFDALNDETFNQAITGDWESKKTFELF